MNGRVAGAIGVILLLMPGVCLSARRLVNGVTVSGISGSDGSENFYEIQVPPGRAQLEVSIWTGSYTWGDCDLYVRRGALPTTALWDYRPYLDGSNETVVVDLPAPGTWYIMLRAYHAYAGVYLRASYPEGDVISLFNCVPVSGLSGEVGSLAYFSIEVPAKRTELEIATHGGTGDCDLYIRVDAVPTTSLYHLRSVWPTNNEGVRIYNPPAGTWYILVYGYLSYDDVTFHACYRPEATSDVAVDTIRFSPPSLLAAKPGQRLATSCHICNIGFEDLPPLPGRVYLSKDDTLTESDYLLGMFQSPAVEAGRWKSLDVAFTLPAIIPTGSYHVVYTIDVDDEIAETCESNNTAFAAGFTILPSFTATCPVPLDKGVDASQTLLLRWIAGRKAAWHDVYFGQDATAVGKAFVTDTGIYRDRLPAGTETWPVGPLEWGKTYYWRIDEVNDLDSRSPWTGDVWSFTTADFLIVDDFESYTADSGSRINETWLDGKSYKGAPQPGNGTGSTVGHMSPPFTEQDIVHGGRQAMPIEYNNVSIPYHSEAQRTWPTGQDWTVNGMDTLVLCVQGKETNDGDPLYVVVRDSDAHEYFAAYDNPTAAQATEWLEWTIPLSRLTTAGVNVAAIQEISVGIGDRDGSLPGGAGVLYIDDIRVIRLGGGDAPADPER